MGLEDDMLHGAAPTRDDIEPPRPDGMPRSADERHLRRLLAVRVAMPGSYYDDGEAQGQEHGISIDFMREPVADIDAKLRALNVARAEATRRQKHSCDDPLCAVCGHPWAA